MCDYCGCRETGPTAELASEHVRLQELSERLRSALATDEAVEELFDEFNSLLEMHAAKEEIGLFAKVARLRVMDDQIDQLVAEHEVLRGQLAAGATGPDVGAALKLLAQHIDDEEYGFFPHVFHALDPEEWDEIELAHRAVEAVFLDTNPAESTGHDHHHGHGHGHGHDSHHP